MRRARLRIAAPLAAAMLALAGCGNSDGEGGGGEGGGAPKVAGAAATVDMKNIEYVPKAVTVNAGDTVGWNNGDSVAHTVTYASGPGAKFDSGTLAPNKQFKQRFDRAGKVDYVCTLHPNQTGTVTVR